MKHEAAINRIFESFYEPWMSEEDKAYIREEMIRRTGISLEQFDKDLETGVKNGYPIEFQLELVRRIFEKK